MMNLDYSLALKVTTKHSLFITLKAHSLHQLWRVLSQYQKEELNSPQLPRNPRNGLTGFAE